MKLKTARKLEQRLRTASDLLNACVYDASKEMDGEEFERWKGEAGNVMGLIFLRLLQPIYDEHAELTPKQLRSKTVRGARLA